jgi:threonine dehydratase
MSIAARAMRPDVEIIGVQAALYPSMAAKMKGETLPCGGDSIAEGISVKEPGTITQASFVSW